MLLEALLLLLFTDLHQALKVGVLVEGRQGECLTVAPVLILDRLLHHLLYLRHLGHLLLFTFSLLVLHEDLPGYRGQPILILLPPQLLPKLFLPFSLLTPIFRRERIRFFKVLMMVLRKVMGIHFVHQLGRLWPQQT